MTALLKPTSGLNGVLSKIRSSSSRSFWSTPGSPHSSANESPLTAGTSPPTMSMVDIAT